MSEEEEKRKKEKEDVEELREVLSVISKEIPSLIKGIIGSIFSEEAGRDMGKATAAFYKELKEAGMPEETAVKMTEDYMSILTSLDDIMKKAVSGEKMMKGKGIDVETSKKIKEKLGEKLAEKAEKAEE